MKLNQQNKVSHRAASPQRKLPLDRRWPVSLALIAISVGCASTVPAPDYDSLTAQMMRSSFKEEGIAKLGRLDQDESNAACSKALGGRLNDAQAAAIQEAALKTVKMPTGGEFLGDWRKGEALAQNGRGMTWTDKSAAPNANGGSCYNCHQISKEEISYGTIGPSLYQYGKLRGVTDPSDPKAKGILEYTWTKLWNAKAYNACSGMPRFGHSGLLDEGQLKDLMALILDPKSPVNR
ncbi:MAG: sulfur oxidation c-type cytochrome SoxX [Betaproteobacteria bacterium]|nr:sulfur oxidation c-type cytochrome SoxX [Betaproteobacteria bacterium]